jgi:hypothetical protein
MFFDKGRFLNLCPLAINAQTRASAWLCTSILFTSYFNPRDFYKRQEELNK